MTLQVRSVTVRFGGLAAVDDVTLDIERSAITGLIGPNGAGKTTLFNVMTGLQNATSGQVLWDGVDITNLAAHRRARLGISRTFQALQLFGSLSVRDNVSLAARRTHGARRSASMVDELLARCGVADIAESLAGALPPGRPASSNSPERSPAIPRCCCSTNRRRGKAQPRPTDSPTCCAPSRATGLGSCWSSTMFRS